GIPNPEGKPQAELWMGSHPLAPSQVTVSGKTIGLDRLIAGDPEGILGSRVARSFAGELPFLFKVLAAGLPLSIQAHPNKAQARAGFERENKEGIPLTSPKRNYKDPNHKPEIICALSEFDALCSFRTPEEIAEFFSDFEGDEARRVRDELSGGGSDTERVKNFYSHLLMMDEESVNRLISAALDSRNDSAERRMASYLASCYPGDRGALAPFFLNLIRLQPGDAVALEAGELHAYISGIGVECMANSDNVLRGGLTSKHIDLDELSACLTYEGKDVHTVPLLASGNEVMYATKFEEFTLSRISLESDSMGLPSESAQILLCVRGMFVAENGEGSLAFSRGDSVFVAAGSKPLRIRGSGTLYRAHVPVKLS
ncbi:MAG TPA: mannose-6-phosphate isomerase, class I, partial [Spirochaetia bacterium]|nr:mannose-6-phosphate isomerase, class I [Spirochaetia bacterium]